MKQLTHDLRTGEASLEESPRPRSAAGTVVVAATRSLVSAGTERMLVEFGKAGWVGKARQQQDKVKEVLDKARTDGVSATVEAVRSKLEQPIQLGYSSVGRVLELGAGVEGLQVGDRVVSNGPHAEVVRVPRNLCAPIPDGVSDDAAAFTVVGAIGLQGIRLAEPTLGESFVVTGAGLIGLMVVQLLRASGCRVLAVDFDPTKLALAKTFGAETVDLSKGEDPVAAAESFSRGRGVDGVILALTSKSSEPVSQAARMCRKRGRVVLVGVTGLELSRADFFQKEISFRVSCSYGPGRYDPSYEEGGQDYPVGFVRWTEQRNFEAVLDMMVAGALDVEPLISHRFDFEDAPDAYELLTSGNPSLAILLEYSVSEDEAATRTVTFSEVDRAADPVAPVVSFIGAGNYASRTLAPAFRDAGARLRSVATSAGTSGVHMGKKYGFEETTTDVDRVLADAETGVVVVATPHDSHPRFVAQALKAGKHVFVEKPLAIDWAGLERVEAAYRRAGGAGGRGPLLMLGFNRRFAPHTVRAKEMLASVRGPKAFVMTVNAGAVPREHWIQDRQRGGGRIVGEGCHFIDLLRHLAESPITDADITTLEENGRAVDDVSTITLKFADGSHGAIHYLASGHKGFPKERLEIFAGGRVLQLDNFRRLRAWGWNSKPWGWSFGQDKGNAACVAAFVEAVQDGRPAPIPFDEIMEVSRVSVEVAEAARGQ